MTLELHAVLVNAPEALQREHLKATGVGEHGAVPGGEPMEPAQVLDDGLTGTQMEMIGVTQNDLRAGSLHVSGAEAPNDAVGADRHECRRADFSVRQSEGAGPGGTGGSVNPEFEHQGTEIRIRSIWRRCTRSCAPIIRRMWPTLSGPRSACTPVRSS